MRLVSVFMAASLLRSTTAFTSKLCARHLVPRSNNIAVRAMTTKYWNREESTKQNYDSSSPIVKEARIISLSSQDDDANKAVNFGTLPKGATLLAIGANMDEFDIDELKQQEPNVIFVAHPMARQPLADLLETFPTIEWIHARSAGIDFCTSPTLSKFGKTVVVTNAKGTFSSTLAEYTLMACSYFAKNIPRLEKQKQDKLWKKYSVLELRRATLGIIGYGDIGRACAKLANAYGMRVIALRRNPTKDPLCDVVYKNTNENLNRLMSESDYILCSAPLTKETKGMIGKEAFEHAKQDSVFINVGRGPIVDENALIEALKNGSLKGAALDVFETEPLPESSELWDLPNVLVSPHNMDQTETFMHEATEFFIEENLPRFVRGETVLNPVDPAAGY